MATFSAQIVSLVGGTVVTSEIEQWLVNGAKEVINSLPPNLLEHCTDKSAIADGNGLAIGNATDVGKVLYATRSDGSYEQPCRLLTGAQGDLADDSTAISYYATANDPAYFIRDNTVFIKPNPTDAQNGQVYHVTLPTSVDSSTNAIASFPEEAEYLVVLYAATQQLLQFLADETSNEDSELYAINSDKYAKLLAEYQKGLTLLAGPATSRGR